MSSVSMKVDVRYLESAQDVSIMNRCLMNTATVGSPYFHRVTNSREIGNRPIDQKASGHGKQKLNLISDFFPVFLSAK